MEVVIFTGVPAAGKTTFYKERFFPSHVYVSLDQLKSRSAEKELFEFCLKRDKPCVIDNTNVKRTDRRKYISAAKVKGAKVVGYCFLVSKEQAVLRNGLRSGRACVPETAIRSMYRELEYPEIGEGYDELYYVSLADGKFVVEEYDEKQNK